MFGFYLGIYWSANRALTLRQYADATCSFLKLLRRLHPVFQALEWVGDGANSAVHLSPDLCNLNDLIYRHAGRNDAIYQDKNPDGTPSWASVGKIGYGMVYEVGKSAEASGVIMHAPRAATLRNDPTLNDLIFEQLPDGGTLISLGTDIISPDNLVQVTKARRLRSRLLAEGFF